MSDTDINSASPRISALELMHRLAMPAFLFSGVLCLLLMLSWVFAVPRFTSFELGGSVVDVRTLREYGEELETALQELETRRNDMVLPSHTDLVHALHDALDPVSPILAYDAVLQTVDRFNVEHTIVSWERVEYDAAASSVTITGMIANVGPRSMTVLAQFTEELSQLAVVEAVDGPVYKREVSASGESYSPFTITVHLASSAADDPS